MAGLLNMTPQELYSALSAKIGPVDMRKINEGLQHGGLAPSFFVDEVCLALMGWDVTLRDIRWLELPSGAWSERLVTYFEIQNALSNRIVLGFVKGSAHHCVLGTVNNGGRFPP